jgi:hypothetical protein
MSQWQPRYDPRRQQPQVPPEWRQRGYPPAAAEPGQPQWQQPRHYQPPQPPPGAPRRKSRKGLAGLGCGGAAGLLILVAALASSSPSSSAPPAGAQQPQAAAPARAQAAAAAQTVTYVVTGSPADVTYGPAGSSLSGSVPLRVTKPLGTPAYYSVQAQLQGSGSVSCEIDVDGKAVSRGTASGGYQIASCEIVQDPFSGQWQDANG